MRSQCTGESNVANPLTIEEFYRPVSDELLEVVLTYSCSKWNVSIPNVVKLPDRPRKFAGKYKQSTNTIQYNRDILGLILHELAHHINKCTNGTHPLPSHGTRYGEILQELLDLWR